MSYFVFMRLSQHGSRLLDQKKSKESGIQAIPGLKFRIIERGGQTIASQLQLSNPTTSDKCFDSDCQPCSQPGGSGGRKKCHKNNVVYQYVCQVPGCSATYTGETSKNMFTRSSQHKEKYEMY